MISFLFWNLGGTHRPARLASLRGHLVRMAQSLDVDLFLFVEPAFPATELEAAFFGEAGQRYNGARSTTARIQILSRLPAGVLRRRFDSPDERMTIRSLTTTQGDVLLAVLHLHSQLHRTREEQGLEATVIRDEITWTENLVGHQRTLLVGDFNLNPFDVGIVGAQGLNAVMTRQIAAAGTRQVSGRRYRYFYNPMWACFGDRTPGPAGTYYYSGARPIAYHWNMFDQLLLRPALVDLLLDLRILDTDGQETLLTSSGRPNAGGASDHLPILFRLDAEAREP